MLFVRITVSEKKKSLQKIKKYHKMSCERILMADRKIFSRLLMIWMLISLPVLLSCTEKESIEISNADFKGLRDYSPGREVDWS